MNTKKKPEIDPEHLPLNPLLGFGLLDNTPTNVAKLYKSSANRKLIATLSGSAAKMLIWIIQELEPGKDYVWVDKDRYQKERGIKSMKTVNAALVELDNKRFIDGIAGKKDVYFINPVIFFCGSRINKYPECVSR